MEEKTAAIEGEVPQETCLWGFPASVKDLKSIFTQNQVCEGKPW
jgi:hypothetical protein